MSEINGFFLTQLFIRNSSLSGSAYAVAIIIADKYDQRRGYSSVSSRTIAQLAGVSTKTVTTALNEIEESGEWLVEKAKGATTRYYPVVSKVSARQEKRTKAEKGSRGIALAAKTGNDEEKPKSEKRKIPVTEAKKLPEPKPILPEYPETGEDTDPYLNGLPIVPSETGSLGDIVRPPALSNPLAMAIRLHKRTDIRSRVNKDEFTVLNISKLIESLTSTGAPLEAIDILLWLQCENRKPLSESFLSMVLSKCVNNGVMTKPVKWYEDKEDPAYELARKVYETYTARHAKATSEYAEYL